MGVRVYEMPPALLLKRVSAFALLFCAVAGTIATSTSRLLMTLRLLGPDVG